MKILIFLLLMTSTVSAASDCIRGRSDLIGIVDWSAENTETGTHVTMTITNKSNKSIKMVEGGVYFKDALDRVLGGAFGMAPFDPDLKISAGSTIQQKSRSAMLDRLPNIEKSNVTPFSCVFSVLYGDGTTEKF